MPRSNTVKDSVLRSIRARKVLVILRAELEGLGSERQVTRALRQLVDESKIAQIGRGVYTRLQKTKYADYLVLEKTLTELAYDFARKKGAEIRLTKEEKDWISGRSTQMPMGNIVALDRQINQKLRFRGGQVRFEKVPEG